MPLFIIFYTKKNTLINGQLQELFSRVQLRMLLILMKGKLWKRTGNEL